MDFWFEFMIPLTYSNITLHRTEMMALGVKNYLKPFNLLLLFEGEYIIMVNTPYSSESFPVLHVQASWKVVDLFWFSSLSFG